MHVLYSTGSNKDAPMSYLFSVNNYSMNIILFGTFFSNCIYLIKLNNAYVHFQVK